MSVLPWLRSSGSSTSEVQGALVVFEVAVFETGGTRTGSSDCTVHLLLVSDGSGVRGPGVLGWAPVG